MTPATCSPPVSNPCPPCCFALARSQPMSHSEMISECALALALERSALPWRAQEGGVLTPATAFGDVLVRRLEATGVFQFESGVVAPEAESRKQR